LPCPNIAATVTFPVTTRFPEAPAFKFPADSVNAPTFKVPANVHALYVGLPPVQEISTTPSITPSPVMVRAAVAKNFVVLLVAVQVVPDHVTFRTKVIIPEPPVNVPVENVAAPLKVIVPLPPVNVPPEPGLKLIFEVPTIIV
jgi:hypothetical protein